MNTAITDSVALLEYFKPKIPRKPIINVRKCCEENKIWGSWKISCMKAAKIIAIIIDGLRWAPSHCGWVRFQLCLPIRIMSGGFSSSRNFCPTQRLFKLWTINLAGVSLYIGPDSKWFRKLSTARKYLADFNRLEARWWLSLEIARISYFSSSWAIFSKSNLWERNAICRKMIINGLWIPIHEFRIWI